MSPIVPVVLEQRILPPTILGASHQESGCCVLSPCPRQLFKDEAVVELVLVESPDYVVTVMVNVGSLVVGLEAGAVGV